ncbi:MAG TPA: cardiolipin synthase [Calditrichia bacterium]|nr:cardiolipin synthase [Calditrichota bacterium]HQV32002.1 cardiolipin synthase [Calditrichia bacterium]
MMTLFWLVLGLIYLASLGLIFVIILRKPQPSAALAWILSIVFLPIAGALLYLVFGSGRLMRTNRRKQRANQQVRLNLLSQGGEVKSQAEKILKDLPAPLENIATLTSRLGSFNVLEGNQVRFLNSAEAAYDEMEKAITSAEHHIHLQSYIIQPDHIGRRFQELLIKKASQGVMVHLLYDAIGSYEMGKNKEFLAAFREAGIYPREFLPLRTFLRPWNLNLRNHRKILVVDNRIGFTGSLNIGGEFLTQTDSPDYDRWRETHLMMEGPAVTQLQWVFAEDWFFTTHIELSTEAFFQPAPPCGEDLVQVIASGPDDSRGAIHQSVLSAINEAQESVDLITPYFIPDETFLITLEMASRKGVDIRLIVPRKADHTFVSLATRSYYTRLLKSGVRVFEYQPGMLHTKLMTVDGHFSVIGSANLDIRSFGDNFEVNVQLYGARSAGEAQRIFEGDLENSREILLPSFMNRPMRKRVAENSCRLLSPLL